MKVFFILFVLPLCVIYELGSACNSYYGEYGGLFGNNYAHGHPHVHMNAPGYGYHNQYAQGHYGGFGGMVDSLLRTDFGGSHTHHHHLHGHRPLIPISHHSHVHRVHRRSVHSHRSRTTLT